MKNPGLIGLAGRFEPLKPHTWNNNSELEITIATLGDKGTPRNFSFDQAMDFPKTCTGGCKARIWCSDGSGAVHHYFGHYGPDISLGSLADYEYSLRALKTIRRGHDAIYKVRGGTEDAGTLMGQWLEACGVEKIYVRPEGSKHVSWLNEGEWEQWTIARTVQEIRHLYYRPPVPATEPQLAIA